MAGLDLLDALDRLFHELVIDRLLHERAAGAGTDFALVQGKHGETFERLVEEIVIFGHDVSKENVRRFATEFQRHRNDVFRRVLHDEPARRRLAGEGDLGDALVLRQRLSSFDTETVDDVEHAGRQDVGDDVGEHHDACRGLLGRFHHNAIAGGESRGKLPRRHQQREVPRDDLSDDAERLMEMIGDRGVVEFREAALLREDTAGEIAEMIDDERHVGSGRLADRLAVVDRFGEREQVELAFEPVGDLVQEAGALRRRGIAPGLAGGVRGVQRQFDVFGRRACHLAERLAGDRAYVVEVLAFDRRDPFAADEIVIAFAKSDLLLQFLKALREHIWISLSSVFCYHHYRAVCRGEAIGLRSWCRPEPSCGGCISVSFFCETSCLLRPVYTCFKLAVFALFNDYKVRLLLLRRSRFAAITLRRHTLSLGSPPRPLS